MDMNEFKTEIQKQIIIHLMQLHTNEVNALIVFLGLLEEKDFD